MEEEHAAGGALRDKLHVSVTGEQDVVLRGRTAAQMLGSWSVQIMQVMGCTNCIRKSMLKYSIPQQNVYPTMALITQYGQRGLVV